MIKEKEKVFFTTEKTEENECNAENKDKTEKNQEK
jgi:hypothetical protein